MRHLGQVAPPRVVARRFLHASSSSQPSRGFSILCRTAPRNIARRFGTTRGYGSAVARGGRIATGTIAGFLGVGAVVATGKELKRGTGRLGASLAATVLRA